MQKKERKKERKQINELVNFLSGIPLLSKFSSIAIVEVEMNFRGLKLKLLRDWMETQEIH